MVCFLGAILAKVKARSDIDPKIYISSPFSMINFHPFCCHKTVMCKKNTQSNMRCKEMIMEVSPLHSTSYST